MSRGLNYWPGSPLIDGGGQVFNIVAYGGKGNDSFLNDQALADMTAAAVAAGGGIPYFPPGIYLFQSLWNLDSKSLLRIVGCGSNQFGNGAATTLIYTGSGSTAAISARLCRGVRFWHMAVKYSQAGFTGYLMNFGPTQSGDATANCGLIDCNLRPTSDANAGGPAALVYNGSNYGFNIAWSSLRGGQVNILCKSQSYDFQNAISYRDSNFSLSTLGAIKAPDNTEINTCFFEPLVSNAAGALVFDTTRPSNSITFINPWIGDDHAGVTGTWIQWGAGKNLSIKGGQIGCNTSTTGFQFIDNASQSVEIDTRFVGNGGSSTAIDFGSTTGHTGLEINSTYPGVTNQYKGTIPDGTIHNFGGVTTLVSPTLTGNIAITATQGITTPLITVTGAPPQPNVLSAASANFETGIGNWLSSFHAASPLTTTTAAALVGTHSLAFQHNNTNATDLTCSIASYGAGPTFPGLHACAPGQSWTGLASVRCPPSTTPRLIQLDIYAVTGVSGGTLQNLTKVGTTGFTVRDSVSQWTPFVVNLTNGTLPATLGGSGLPPAFLCLILTFGESSGTNYIALNEIHWVDCCSLSQSTSTDWQDPAASTQTNTITPTSMQFSSDGSVLSSGAGKVSINRGPNAGTGGTDLGGNVQALDGFPTWTPGTAIGTGASGGVVGSNSDFTFNVTVGTTPAASAIVATITLSSAFTNTIGSVSVTPCNANAAALSGAAAVFENYLNRTANSFELDVGSTPLQTGLNYAWNVMVRG